MYIIGISAFYHDSSACLFRDGKLIFACEEEKFTGIKHDGSFPEKTLEFIFKTYKINKSNISAVCYYESPDLKLKRVLKTIKPQILTNPIYSFTSLWDILMCKRKLNKLLPKISDNVFYSTHHEAHLYYSYYTSNFDDAVCLSVDGVGEFDTITYGVINKNHIQKRTLAEYPHSLGLFYSALTAYLGFKPNEGEYKVMGLAPYGDPKKYINKVRKLVTFKNGGLICDMDKFCWNKSNKTMFNEKLIEFLELDPRLPDTELNQGHKDLAAAVQKRYEEVLVDVLKSISMIDSNQNLCLSGGCAYNGSANGKITKLTNFSNLWIPVAPSDAGSAVGACIHYMVENGISTSKVNRNPFIGPQYNLNDLIKNLKGKKYKKFNSELSLLRFLAKRLANGETVGWFQGHNEFGARALGNRSILANPTLKSMKDKINKTIKKRESFRPFAPMVIKEKQDIFFDVDNDVPYMNQIVNVKPEYVEKLPAVTHIDGTARIQTVYKNTLVHDLLTEFENLTGYPILLNTSFNIKDKTIVRTPKDALDMYFNSDLDLLVIGYHVIFK
jgi:carbamoyltransferase